MNGNGNGHHAPDIHTLNGKVDVMLSLLGTIVAKQAVTTAAAETALANTVELKSSLRSVQSICAATMDRVMELSVARVWVPTAAFFISGGVAGAAINYILHR